MVSFLLCTYQAAFDQRSPGPRALGYLLDVVFVLAALHRALRARAARHCAVSPATPNSSSSSSGSAWLLLAVAANAPVDLVAAAAGAGVELQSLLRLNRTLRLTWVVAQLQAAGRALLVQPMRHHVFKFIVLVGLMLHALACGWAMLACPLGRCGEQASWLQLARQRLALDGNATNDSGFYTANVYWTMATLTSTGYGDLHGVTALEQWFSVAVMLTGIIMFGFLFGGFASILSNRDSPLVYLSAGGIV